MQHTASMTLGNMRANGVRTLAAWYLGRGCDHFRVLDVSGYPDDVPVPSFGLRLRCERGGHVGAAQGQFMTHLRHRVRPTDLCTKPLAVDSMRANAQWQ